MAIARSALMGPLGGVSAAMTAGMTAMAHAQAAAALKQAHAFFTWQCSDAPAGASAKRDPASVQFTDLTDLGPQTIGGVTGNGYHFYVKENGRFDGPVRVLVARESGMPRRFEFADPRGGGKMAMNYSDFDKPAKIDLPSCLAGK